MVCCVSWRKKIKLFQIICNLRRFAVEQIFHFWVSLRKIYSLVKVTWSLTVLSVHCTRKTVTLIGLLLKSWSANWAFDCQWSILQFLSKTHLVCGIAMPWFHSRWPTQYNGNKRFEFQNRYVRFSLIPKYEEHSCLFCYTRDCLYEQ